MSTDSRSPGRNRGFIVAGMVVGVIVLAAIVLAVTFLFRGGDNNADPKPTPAPSASATADAEPSACGLEGFEETSSLDTAPDNKWELVGTVAAPTDPDVGPGTVKDGLRSCYAHTAEGALFAAANFVASGTDATLGPRLIALVAPGPGRDALQAESSTGGASNLRAQFAGFKVAAYSADTATIDLALNYSTGELVSIPLKLEWVEGDWKIQMTSEGELPLAPAQLQNLGGYTPWSGA